MVKPAWHTPVSTVLKGTVNSSKALNAGTAGLTSIEGQQ
jgi:hypothetical protein